MQRYLFKQVQKDLKRKMVFIGGPRQVGKTTLARQFLTNKKYYFNWDLPVHREMILKHNFPIANTLVLDEIHKYKLWRNYIKGLYDVYHEQVKIIVTGSARLDYYRYGGDSLQGRYFYLRLHPLSLAECGSCTKNDLIDLLNYGGFPEPFFMSSIKETKRWSRDYRARFMREDLTQLESIHDVGQLEKLMLRLPELVASPLSVNNLREDLQLSHKVVSRWLDIFERLYVIFRITPFGYPRLRAVKKEQKHYHFDWTLISDLPKRFENLVACHLLKWVNFMEDTQGQDLELRYFRDVDNREVDFVIVENQKPILFCECKWSDDEIGKGLRYLKNKFPEVKSYQISAQGKKDYLSKEGIRVCPAPLFLKDFI